ncbi:hypothetical protein NDR87_23990 [Nocardia sp. CDC159]|uniref:Protein kinase n=1 Tax=Nocardia pulmonis TaxID=2951408 RepID=A0A9X2J1H3_9NOCA|nr:MULTISPECIES: DUF6764 family protein [Nocardia]MCM6777011.1 hypothetical protein [Nocardia pulmonis]MCM6789435.1 hypothetical protein [Nocardia sp. CDC159]
MKVLGSILCSAAVMGACFWVGGTASATGVHCDSDAEHDVIIVAGSTACRAVTTGTGHARALSLDGVGYARATAGTVAVALGASGGTGASEGRAGLPVAIGFGRDAVAHTSLDETGRVGVTIALNGSRAQVVSADREAVCLGSAALAWDSHSGAACVATPVGLWRTPPVALP